MMMYKCEITFNDTEKKFSVLKHEFANKQERSEAILKKKGKKVAITINASDSTALRAAMNFVGRSLVVCEKIERLGENERRKTKPTATD